MLWGRQSHTAVEAHRAGGVGSQGGTAMLACRQAWPYFWLGAPSPASPNLSPLCGQLRYIHCYGEAERARSSLGGWRWKHGLLEPLWHACMAPLLAWSPITRFTKHVAPLWAAPLYTLLWGSREGEVQFGGVATENRIVKAMHALLVPCPHC